MSLWRFFRDWWTGPLVHVFEDVLDGRLGRQQLHDPKSRLFDVTPIAGWRKPWPTKPVVHKRHGPIYDQGQLGCCVGMSGAGMMMTEPFYIPGRAWDLRKGIELYGLSTKMDDPTIPGVYPPNDTGSSGTGLGKALKSWGVVRGYRWAFGLRETVSTIAVQPVCAGLPWFDSMMEPDRNGVVSISPGAQLAGGHEIEILGVDPTRQLVKFAQSWGPEWGDHGYGYMAYSTLDALLRQGGDVMTGVLL